MTQTLTGLFDRFDDAKSAVTSIEQAGVPHNDISIVANNADGTHGDHSDGTATAAGQDAATGAGLGATVGGIGGLLAGLGLLVVPGVGPVLAAGWLGSTIIGAAAGGLIGAAAGGLVGALTQAGVPEEDAHVYAEGVRRGGSLVTARVDEALVPAVRAILQGDESVDISERRTAYREGGWNRFDEDAPKYTSDQVAEERARFERV